MTCRRDGGVLPIVMTADVILHVMVPMPLAAVGIIRACLELLFCLASKLPYFRRLRERTVARKSGHWRSATRPNIEQPVSAIHYNIVVFCNVFVTPVCLCNVAITLGTLTIIFIVPSHPVPPSIQQTTP